MPPAIRNIGLPPTRRLTSGARRTRMHVSTSECPHARKRCAARTASSFRPIVRPGSVRSGMAWGTQGGVRDTDVYLGDVDVPEAPVEATAHGLVCKGDGWFVVNAREMRWFESEGWGRFSNFGGDTVFEQLGFGITVLGPGQPLSMYHWETDQGGLPRPRRHGDPDRRGAGAAAAAVG